MHTLYLSAVQDLEPLLKLKFFQDLEASSKYSQDFEVECWSSRLRKSAGKLASCRWLFHREVIVVVYCCSPVARTKCLGSVVPLAMILTFILLQVKRNQYKRTLIFWAIFFTWSGRRPSEDIEHIFQFLYRPRMHLSEKQICGNKFVLFPPLAVLLDPSFIIAWPC